MTARKRTAPKPVEPTVTEPPKVEADWSVLEIPGVAEVLTLAANKIGGEYGSVTTPDDMHQEGSIILASNPEIVQRYLGDQHFGERALFQWLRSRLVDTVKTDAARSKQTITLVEGLTPDGE